MTADDIADVTIIEIDGNDDSAVDTAIDIVVAEIVLQEANTNTLNVTATLQLMRVASLSWATMSGVKSLFKTYGIT
jgi:hypothetical protein